MNDISRRRFLASLAMGGVAAAWRSNNIEAAMPKRGTAPVPMLHVTDLFRPHGDPDDHWDLACVFALAHQGRVDLRTILIDYPPVARHSDPDVLGVAQMNFLTGQTVPVMVGSPPTVRSGNDTQSEAAPLKDGGVHGVLRLLRESPRPLVINVLGSCCDVAAAGKRDPKLFAKKCAAIYLNAGTGTPEKAKAARLEYNVRLNPAAYAAIFALPCPIYWMPCYEEIPTKGVTPREGMEFGTYYRFLQGDILPHLSPRMRNFFAYMYKHGRYHKSPEPPGCDWLRYLLGPADETLLARLGAQDRKMWCTGGFLHAAGLTVSRDGRIIPLAGSRDKAVFTFEPIQVRCADDGVTQWTKIARSRDRFIFRVCDCERYSFAMTAAMKSLLMMLP